jgi:hypothetical protein
MTTIFCQLQVRFGSDIAAGPRQHSHSWFGASGTYDSGSHATIVSPNYCGPGELRRYSDNLRVELPGFDSRQRPDRLWDPHSLLSNEYRGPLHGGQVAGA